MNLAAIFDLDGVIVDNMGVHKQAWLEICRRYGKSMTDEQFEREISGRVNAAIFAMVLGRPVAGAELARLEHEKEALYRDLFRPHLRPVAGLEAFLKELQAKNIPAAVATSAPPDNIEFVIDGLKLRPYFGAIVDASEVRRGKPDPEVYLTAAGKLGVDPRRCVAFEDALLGIQAARAAGMKVVGLSTTHPAAELAGAATVIPDFINFKVAGLKEILAADPAWVNLFGIGKEHRTAIREVQALLDQEFSRIKPDN